MLLCGAVLGLAWTPQPQHARHSRSSSLVRTRRHALPRSQLSLFAATRAAPAPPRASKASAAMHGIEVDIGVTGINSRSISASCIVAAPPECVWAILTDYDNLSTHVPNLVVSERRPHPTGGIRLFQEGAQKIVGFDFRASLEMDMQEISDDGPKRPSRIDFTLVDSAMFAAFDGSWCAPRPARAVAVARQRHTWTPGGAGRA